MQFHISEDGIVMIGKCLCVLKDTELRKLILQEAHCSYSIHPGGTKMYCDLKEFYWWINMKKDIAEFVAKCLTCQQLKAEHQRPSRLLYPLEILQWKWDYITMDFVTALPKTPKGHDSFLATIGMAPFKAFYGRKLRTPLFWEEVGERELMEPKLLQEAQEKIAPMRGIVRFGKTSKLSPRFIGPFEILQRIGPEAYRLAPPPALVGVHEVFYVSLLGRYVENPSHVVSYKPLQLRADLTYEETPSRFFKTIPSRM
ncbi:uncharacterized protein LOC122665595 [Telopea speciosissima]|uniref:uncharacterized protein LOC122665595 n=1 Tax=Telopea speciosissima TaxID=54955 RepID=UPI001CC61256|nr:uncharacterized protein LOC122665595 [Telopea speciosissima]